MRLIDADKLKKQFNKSPAGSAAISIIEDAPTVDAQPVKRGKWLAVDKSGIRYKRVAVCSACDERANYLHNFCPNCGSDMRGEEA